MQLAKPLRRSPRDIAASLADALLASPYLEKVEIAGAGFINLFLTTSVKQQFPQYVLKGGATFGHVDVGAGKKIQVEFVSANPTGPLHVGHGRGAAFGASLANVLAAGGILSRASTMSTMQGGRWIFWRSPPGCVTWS